MKVPFFKLLLLATVITCNFFVTPIRALSSNLQVEVIEKQSSAEDDDFLLEEDSDDNNLVSDPLEVVNRQVFSFNDFLIEYLVTPSAIAWKFLLPRFVRRGISNAIKNEKTGMRFVTSLFQAKFAGASRELARFTINTSLGVGGLFDPAQDLWQIERSDEDSGQMLGAWGFSPGIHVAVPFLGPKSVRSTVGYTADIFLTPETYIFWSNFTIGFLVRVSLFSVNLTNEVSLNLGEYQEFKKDSIDPYSYFRDLYFQHRAKKVKD